MYEKILQLPNHCLLSKTTHVSWHGSISWLAGGQEIYIAFLDSRLFLDPFHKDLRGNDVLANQSATINIGDGSWISQRDLQLQRRAGNLLFGQFFP